VQIFDVIFSVDEFLIADAEYAVKPLITITYKYSLVSLTQKVLFNTLFFTSRSIEHVKNNLIFFLKLEQPLYFNYNTV
jgi:hypothetical protein